MEDKDPTPEKKESSSLKPKLGKPDSQEKKGLSLNKPGGAPEAKSTSGDGGGDETEATKKKPVKLAKPRPAVSPSAKKPSQPLPKESSSESSSGEQVSVPLLVLDVVAAAACITFAVLLYLESANTTLDGSTEVRAPATEFNLTYPGSN